MAAPPVVPAVPHALPPVLRRWRPRAMHAALMALALLLAPALEAGRTIRVGLYQNSPKIGIADDGRGEGIFADILAAIAAREDWRIEYVPGTWGEGLARLEAGEIDLMPDVARTAERERRFAFHDEPVLSSWNQVYTRAHSRIRALPDLENQRVAVLEASVQMDDLHQLLANFSLRAAMQRYPDYPAAFAAVAADEADAVVTNRFFGVRHAARYGLVDTAIIFSPSRLHFATRPDGDRTLLAAIDRHLRALKDDPDSAFFRSLARWTVQVEPPRTALPAWIGSAALLALGLLVASVLGVWMLRRQVSAKTAEIARLYAEAQALALRLEQRVCERTAELAATNRELLAAKHAAESADRLKSAFLATMSHELRTPLNSIIGFTGILLQKLAGPLNEEQARQLDMVRDSARHLLALINDILDISKIEAGELRIADEPFDVAASVDKVAAIVHPLAERKALALDVERAPGALVMRGDARRVEQIMLNLLTNAVKFTDHGRVTLRLDAPGSTPAVRLSVADTGMGIRREDLDLLFQPFRQIDGALSRQHEGTGLGLAICKRLATLMGGHIAADSEWGRGSRFTVTLPIGTAAPSAGVRA